MTFINTTPHEVYIAVYGVVPVSEEHQIRLSEKVEKIGEIDHVPFYSKNFGGSDLPPVISDVCYIVSMIVAQTYPDRKDFLIPHDLIRDEKGQIVGCRSLARLG